MLQFAAEKEKDEKVVPMNSLVSNQLVLSSYYKWKVEGAFLQPKTCRRMQQHWHKSMQSCRPLQSTIHAGVSSRTSHCWDGGFDREELETTIS